MTESDDFRGRTLRWKYVAGFPLDIRILEDENEVGRIYHRTNLESHLWAELAGISWRLWHGPGIHPEFRLGFADGKGDLVIGKYDVPSLLRHEMFGPKGLFGTVISFTATIDGSRPYTLENVSSHSATWHGTSDIMIIDAEIALRERNTGTVRITPNALNLDLPPLILLGILMAYKGGIFETVHSRPSDWY